MVDVVPPLDHRYAYGPVPPLTTDTLAVPSFCEGQFASVEEAETTSAHGTEQGVGWNPKVPRPGVVSMFTSVEEVR